MIHLELEESTKPPYILNVCTHWEKENEHGWTTWTVPKGVASHNKWSSSFAGMEKSQKVTSNHREPKMGFVEESASK